MFKKEEEDNGVLLSRNPAPKGDIENEPIDNFNVDLLEMFIYFSCAEKTVKKTNDEEFRAKGHKRFVEFGRELKSECSDQKFAKMIPTRVNDLNAFYFDLRETKDESIQKALKDAVMIMCEVIGKTPSELLH